MQKFASPVFENFHMMRGFVFTGSSPKCEGRKMLCLLMVYPFPINYGDHCFFLIIYLSVHQLKDVLHGFFPSLPDLKFTRIFMTLPFEE